MNAPRTWPAIESMPPRAGGLYLHIPFCRRECAYCSFIKMETDGGVEERYVELLTQRIRRAGDHFGRWPIRSIFLGGGTPTLLTAEQYEQILGACRDAYDIQTDAEITSEANPNSASAELLIGMRKAGVNRVSFGAQSFDAAELAFLERLHDAGEIGRAVERARQAGFDNLNLDLIYGLPGQTLREWRPTLEAAIDLAPEHFSFYSLTAEPGTRLFADVSAGKTVLAADDDQFEIYHWTVKQLAGAGYEQYEISNASRPGRRCVHNYTYWDGGFYLAFGPGAHSHVDGIRWAEIGNIRTWMDRVEADGEMFGLREHLDLPTRAFERLMLGLRTNEGFSPEEVASTLGLNPLAGHEDRLDTELAAGRLRWEGERLQLTDRGRFVSDAVIAGFLPDSPSDSD